jgi:magnesium transporter
MVEDFGTEELVGVEALRDAWPVLDAEERIEGFRALPREAAEDFFLELTTRGHVTLFGGMNARERRVWLRFLPPDDVADVLHEFEPDMRAEMLAMLEEPTRREVFALLAYAEDEAGGLMNPRFARVRPAMKVEEAIRYVRRQAKDHLETIYYVYVLDATQHLMGVVSFRELLLAPGDQPVSEVMHTDVISVPEEMDQEEVARVIAKHDILAVPVVDAEGRVKGIVTVDDVVDVVETEATEDIQKIGGTAALDAPYLQTGVLGMIKKRAGWLMILLIGEMFTTAALANYEDRFAKVLIILLPLIISAGGNSGSQATTLVVRAMALDEVRLRDWWRILRRELASGLLLGLILASIGLLRILAGRWLFDQYTEHYVYVALTVGFSLVGVVTLGTLIGALLPLFLRALKLDPASASAPVVATLLDVSGVLIYFTIAGHLLAGRLL